MIQAIVFDFDGTLFDTRQDIADAVNHARHHFGLRQFSLQEVTAMVGYGINVLAKKAFENTSIQVDRALSLIMAYYTAHPNDKAVLYPGVAQTLLRLNQTLSIVSNKPEQLVRIMLDQHKIKNLFEFVAGGDTFSAKKPDPTAVRVLQARYNLAPQQILVVGDHAPDIEMAKRAGSPSVFCEYGFFGEDQVGADFSITEFSQLIDILSELNRTR